MNKYIKIIKSGSNSTCPVCGAVNNHITGKVCSHCVKVTVKGIVYYANKK
jgi:hypothetical protein